MEDNKVKVIFKGEEVLNMEIEEGFKELTFTSNKEKFKIKVERID